MYPVKAAITDQATKQLAQLLGFEISHIRLDESAGGSPPTVRALSLFDNLQTEHRFILKEQEDQTAFCLYTHYLKPLNLNSPKEYGYLYVDGQPLLVMDYIQHASPDWSDGNGYLKAVNWLVKKDRVTAPHLDALRKLNCFGEMKYYGVQYWLSELEKWPKQSPSNPQARQVWRTVHANQTRIDTYIAELNSVGVQTVVHGDLHLSNILFGEEEYENELFVIDWTEPHIGSVAKDLASLYDNAPTHVKEELIKTYRMHIDFPFFDEIFAKAKLLRDIGYLAWMVGEMAANAQEEIDQNERDRVVKSIILSLP